MSQSSSGGGAQAKLGFSRPCYLHYLGDLRSSKKNGTLPPGHPVKSSNELWPTLIRVNMMTPR